MTSRKSFLYLAPVLVMVLSSCIPLPLGVETGTVRMRLVDAPLAIDAVRVVVTEVSVHRSNGLGGASTEGGSLSATGFSRTGWEVVNAAPTTYDLLTLRDGAFATLAEAQVPSGAYTQIRLKIGPGSHVIVDGVTYPLEVPSGAQSGVKVIHPFTVPSEGLADLTLDFDAEKSVFQSADGRWHLRPTVTATSTTQSGSAGIGG